MPIYEYCCQKCKTIEEEMFPITNFPLTILCKECGGNAFKIISKTSFKLEGGGWASDGYVSNVEKLRNNMKAVDTY
jgi:putative FmdB family regulatory protein